MTSSYDISRKIKKVNGEGNEVTNNKLEMNMNNDVAIGDEIRETPNLLKYVFARMRC